MTQPVVDTSPRGLAKRLISIINKDQELYERIDCYVAGKHDGPYMPEGADDEYRLLAERSITNMIPLLIDSPAQALYVDNFRREGADNSLRSGLPEWKHWQESRLDARQLAIHRGALKYGHSFTVTERTPDGKVITKGLSALNTAAVYLDSANDIDPYAAMTIVRHPEPESKNPAARRGKARMWDGTYEYVVTFTALADADSVRVLKGVAHGAIANPVTRFAASIDLEGRTTGVVAPNIDIQNRINQTMFDLLVAQTYGSFKVRTITGLVPPVRKWNEALIAAGKFGNIECPAGTEPGDPIIDPTTGEAVPKAVNLNARRWFFAEDEKAKFGVLDETPLEGYIKSLDMSIRHLAVKTQTPPHYLLGEIANLSADALHAAETALLRKVEEYRKSFGESWERVFRIALGYAGDTPSYGGEVIWRNTEMQSLSQTADALVKLKELGVPLEGLWNRVPESTRGEIEEWMAMRPHDIEFRKRLAEIEQIAKTFDPQNNSASEQQSAAVPA